MNKKTFINISTCAGIVILSVVLVIMLVKPLPAIESDQTTNTIQSPTDEQSTTVLQSTTQAEENDNVFEIGFEDYEQAEEYIKKYAKQKGYDFDDYPQKLIELTVKDKTAIPFVLDYPSEINKEHNSELSDDELGNGVPLFLQWDSRWGYHKFKNGVVSLDGCAATCFSMAAVYLTENKELTPDKVADYISDSGYFIDGSGTSWDFFTKGVKNYGLKSKNVSVSQSALKSALDRGNPVITSVRKGDFTKKGHYIVICGYDENGFIVNDPFSLVNSEKRWSYERIEPQIKNMWEIYK